MPRAIFRADEQQNRPPSQPPTQSGQDKRKRDEGRVQREFELQLGLSCKLLLLTTELNISIFTKITSQEWSPRDLFGGFDWFKSVSVSLALLAPVEHFNHHSGKSPNTPWRRREALKLERGEGRRRFSLSKSELFPSKNVGAAMSAGIHRSTACPAEALH